MAIEISSDRAICTKCGTDYSRRKGYFPVSYATLHKGIGYIPVCKTCIDNMYNGYLAQCQDARHAVRQVCRKLDLYWSDKVYDVVSRKSTTKSMMTQYIAKINTVSYAGKSYDDTLSEEGTLWSFISIDDSNDKIINMPRSESGDDDNLDGIPEETIRYWGDGYSRSMYERLEAKNKYYTEKYGGSSDMDMGSEILIRQICLLEVSIEKDSASGKSVDKSMNALNNLLGSLNIKPTQKKDDGDAATDNTPFGVWIKRWEDKRPIPEPDPEMKDVDGIVRYISVWFLGHLCKMLGIRNTYCKLYEDEIAKMRVDRPEFEDEDDETLFNDIFGSDGD